MYNGHPREMAKRKQRDCYIQDDCYIQVNFAENIRQLNFFVVYIYRAVDQNSGDKDCEFSHFYKPDVSYAIQHTIFKSDLQ